MTSFERAAGSRKCPAGAVKTGQSVAFTVDASCGAQSLALLLRPDGEQAARIPMTNTDDGFACSHSFERAGLFFFAFEADGGRYLRFAADGAPVFCAEPEWTQQLVCAADYVPASSWQGGIAYQVFPDRFAIGGARETLPGRRYHDDLREQPQWRPDPDGEMRNLDFYGGNFAGIREMLPYLAGLGVTLLYLNPIFEARSNHRYDTGDYLKIDPQLGTEADFAALCAEARTLGIRVILDGVFSHTGDDSRYFNKYGSYDSLGAYQSEQSPYRSWYKFSRWPEEYAAWWGIRTLPEVTEEEPSYERFICGAGGVVDHWMRLGASGFRLDVADELPDGFIRALRAAVKRADPGGLLIGEVWEDASNKVSYGLRRRYFWGDELDGVINYPFRTAVLDFVRWGDAALFESRVRELCLHYPADMLASSLSVLSTHDTARALSALAAPDAVHMTREQQAGLLLSRDDYLRGVEMLKLSFALLFALPGIPMLYYGDEIGMQGFGDPFCRAFFDFERRDEALLAFVRELCALRRGTPALASAELSFFEASGSAVGFFRGSGEARVAFLLNRGDTPRSVALPGGGVIEAAPWRFALCPAPGRGGERHG